MGDTVFYMRSPSPVGLTSNLNDRVIEDLHEFVSIEDALFDSVLKEFVDGSAFLYGEDLRALVGRVLEGPNADLVTRIISHLHRIELDGPGTNDFIDKLAVVESNDAKAAFAPEVLDALKTRVDRLKSVWIALDRQKKAENIGKATGKRLLNIQLICDMRPIFDEPRKKIEGWLPITTMHLVAEGADGLPDGIDVVLSASDVDMLATIAGYAKQKLDVLQNSARDLGAPIPTTEITNKGNERLETR